MAFVAREKYGPAKVRMGGSDSSEDGTRNKASQLDELGLVGGGGDDVGGDER